MDEFYIRAVTVQGDEDLQSCLETPSIATSRKLPHNQSSSTLQRTFKQELRTRGRLCFAARRMEADENLLMPTNFGYHPPGLPKFRVRSKVSRGVQGAGET
jgi:hypothetical protein